MLMEASKLVPIYKPMLNHEESLPRAKEPALPVTVQLSNYDLPQFMQAAADFGSDSYAYVVTPNTDQLIRYCDDAAFRDLYRSAGFVLLDSRFLAYLLRFVFRLRMPTCPGSDVTAQLFDNVVGPDDKLVVIGGSEAQAQLLAQKHGLRGLRHFNPPMGFINDPVAVEECLRFIEEQSPFRFCLLAIGCPQQELLAKALQTRGRARGLALCVGASINFLTGAERRAPQWIQKTGFEWLFRLAQNPARMAGRYLVRGPRIFFLLPRLKFELQSQAASISDSPRP
jgi:exopolysaccharide biosynthesis WecB/TagA/CpsF family protein